MVKKASGAYWTDEEIKEAIEEWRKKRPERLKTGDWKVDDVPFYEPGLPVRADLWHRVDYLDEYDLTWGKKWGASGIGKLKELAVSRPTEYDFHMFMKQDTSQFGWTTTAKLDKWQEEHDNFVKVLRENGVTVHYLKYPEPPIGAYGPMRGLWGIELKVVWGGALVPHFGFSPLSKGRDRFQVEFLVSQGCPVLHTVVGKGIAEPASWMAIADDCMIGIRGLAGNQDGMDQIKSVLQRVGITTVVEAHIAGWVESYQWPAAGTYHPDMFMMPVDLGKMVIYPGMVGWEIIEWFRNHKFELIAIDPDEQKEHLPSNLVILEPGKVIMHEGAKKTIAKVRKAGVEVIEVPYYQNLNMGGGMYCSILQMVRDRGPKLEDIK